MISKKRPSDLSADLSKFFIDESSYNTEGSLNIFAGEHRL